MDHGRSIEHPSGNERRKLGRPGDEHARVRTIAVGAKSNRSPVRGDPPALKFAEARTSSSASEPPLCHEAHCLEYASLINGYTTSRGGEPVDAVARAASTAQQGPDHNGLSRKSCSLAHCAIRLQARRAGGSHNVGLSRRPDVEVAIIP
jgi:hypothetical protein